jgi:Rod binding domain-containing protein
MSGDYLGVLPGAPSPGLANRESLPADRAAKAAREFEGLLLANWLQSVEEGIKAFAGDDDDSGSDTMGAVGVQAVAKGIAERGGIGLAKMLLDHLPAPDNSGTADAVGRSPGRRPLPAEQTALKEKSQISLKSLTVPPIREAGD